MRALGLLIAISFSLIVWGALLVGCSPPITHQRPPAQYMDKPSTARLIVDNQVNVTQMCMSMGLDSHTVACANTEVVIVPDPCEFTGVYAELMCHEIGHVNGWSPDHGQ